VTYTTQQLNAPYQIYKITNQINNKIYIGLTKHSIKKRFKEHCRKCYYKSLITNAILKYGKQNFTIEPLMKDIPGLEQTVYWEIFWIKIFNSTDRKTGYNISNGGNVPPDPTGKLRSKEHKENNVLSLKKGLLLKIQKDPTCSTYISKREWFAKPKYKGKEYICHQFYIYCKTLNEAIQVRNELYIK
jgi:group I intron endonuclease